MVRGFGIGMAGPKAYLAQQTMMGKGVSAEFGGRKIASVYSEGEHLERHF